MSTVIRVEDVSKLYRLGQVGTGTLSDDLSRWWARIRGKEDPFLKVGQTNDRTKKAEGNGSGSDLVWALRDIGFEVKQGEVLGIIGRNGSGKSTLLKLLARVTTPTTGQIKVKGRIASLLEVGTGFHPELTGRENIFLNGAILGMRKQEIARKLDEIIDFSGCERYIDTPVKRYSSGMFVRLAFAVAAHLEPEILIVDEVLAVGDAEFQKRCLGKMKDVAAHGRTVLFVSHQMSMITTLCNRGIVLRNGLIEYDGEASEAVLRYQPSIAKTDCAVFDPTELGVEIGDSRVRLIRAWLEDTDGNVRRVFDLEEPFNIAMRYEILEEGNLWPYANFHFFDHRKEYVCVTAGQDYRHIGSKTKKGFYDAKCLMPGGLLNTGSFSIGVALATIERGVSISISEMDALSFQITEDLDKTLETKRLGYAGVVPGVIRPDFKWSIAKCRSKEETKT
jgi:lipopolysaccharide transport system ATP-binding protein